MKSMASVPSSARKLQEPSSSKRLLEKQQSAEGSSSLEGGNALNLLAILPRHRDTSSIEEPDQAAKPER